MYAADEEWWRTFRGAPEFAGLKVSQNPRALRHAPDAKLVRIPKENGYYLRRFNFDPLGDIGGGMNSGFQAINLAVQFGAPRLILIGFDMQHGPRGEFHHHGPHPTGLRNPTANNIRQWRDLLDAQAEALERRGIEVVNASPASALTKFRRASIPEALTKWAA